MLKKNKWQEEENHLSTFILSNEWMDVIFLDCWQSKSRMNEWKNIGWGKILVAHSNFKNENQIRFEVDFLSINMYKDAHSVIYLYTIQSLLFCAKEKVKRKDTLRRRRRKRKDVFWMQVSIFLHVKM